VYSRGKDLGAGGYCCDLGNIFEEKIGDLYSNNYLYKIIYPEKI
jgi:hypothetical protein